MLQEGSRVMKSAKQLVADANTRVKAIAPADAQSLAMAADTVFVDLRDSAELECDGKIPGAVHVTRGMLNRTRSNIAMPPSSVLFRETCHFLLREWWTIGTGRGHRSADGSTTCFSPGRRIQSLA